jgi:hypothetical protein
MNPGSDNFKITMNKLLWFLFISVFIFETQISFAQKSKDVLIAEASYSWINDRWQISDTSIYVYDSRNNLINYLSQNWDSATNTWISNYRFSCI